MKVRVVYRPDGTVAAIHPAPKSRREGESEAEWLARVFTKCMEGALAGLPYDDIDSSELPQTRKYREAWRGSKAAGLTIDPAKKAEIDAQPTEEERKEIALAKELGALKAARRELTGPAALTCQLEIERLAKELED